MTERQIIHHTTGMIGPYRPGVVYQVEAEEAARLVTCKGFHYAEPAPSEPADVCTWPACQCPIDPGPEPDWCARGLPRAAKPEPLTEAPVRQGRRKKAR